MRTNESTEERLARLERGDVAAAKRHLESARCTSGCGRVLSVVFIVIAILIVLMVVK